MPQQQVERDKRTITNGYRYTSSLSNQSLDSLLAEDTIDTTRTNIPSLSINILSLILVLPFHPSNANNRGAISPILLFFFVRK